MPWWSQEEAENRLRVMVEAIYTAAVERRLQESGSRVGSEGGSEGVARTEKDRGNAGCISMLGRKQVTPKWADDPVQIHVGRR